MDSLRLSMGSFAFPSGCERSFLSLECMCCGARLRGCPATNRTPLPTRSSTTRCTSLPTRASRLPFGLRGRAGRLPQSARFAPVARGCLRRSMASSTNCTRRMCPGASVRLRTSVPTFWELRSPWLCCAVWRVLLPAGFASPVSWWLRVWSVLVRQPSPTGDSGERQAVSCLRELRRFLCAVTGESAQAGGSAASLARRLRLVACYEAIPLTGCSSPPRACCLGARTESKRLGPEKPRIGLRSAAAAAWSGRKALSSFAARFPKRPRRATHSERPQRAAHSELPQRATQFERAQRAADAELSQCAAGPSRKKRPASRHFEPSFA